MSRKIAVGLGAGVLLALGTATAVQAHDLYVRYEVYDELCPDTYCGNRSFPDPLLPSGYRFADPGYKGEAYYKRTSWYRQRLARPRMVEEPVPHVHVVERPVRVVEAPPRRVLVTKD
jgi:hypothetical protein